MVEFGHVHARVCDFCCSLLCHAVCRLHELCGMVQVMDPAQASGQIQLFTELHSRFPEVPVDVIKSIMQQVCFYCLLHNLDNNNNNRVTTLCPGLPG